MILKSTTRTFFSMRTDEGEVTDESSFHWHGINIGQVGHAMLEIIIGNTEWHGGL